MTMLDVIKKSLLLLTLCSSLIYSMDKKSNERTAAMYGLVNNKAPKSWSIFNDRGGWFTEKEIDFFKQNNCKKDDRINLQDDDGDTPFLAQIKLFFDKKIIVKEFKYGFLWWYDNGTDLNRQNKMGENILMHLARYHESERTIDWVTKILSLKGIQTALQNNTFQKTAAMIALDANNLTIFETILLHDSNALDVKDSQNKTIIDYLAQYNYEKKLFIKTVQLFIQHKKIFSLCSLLKNDTKNRDYTKLALYAGYVPTDIDLKSICDQNEIFFASLFHSIHNYHATQQPQDLTDLITTIDPLHHDYIYIIALWQNHMDALLFAHNNWKKDIHQMITDCSKWGITKSLGTILGLVIPSETLKKQYVEFHTENYSTNSSSSSKNLLACISPRIRSNSLTTEKSIEKPLDDQEKNIFSLYLFFKSQKNPGEFAKIFIQEFDKQMVSKNASHISLNSNEIYYS